MRRGMRPFSALTVATGMEPKTQLQRIIDFLEQDGSVSRN
jgi:hypothetical protein